MDYLDKPTKMIVYARKSQESEERQVQSIPTQIDSLNKLADLLHVAIIDTVTESKSAKLPKNREKFEALLARINKGEADTIGVYNPNRLSRNAIDAGYIIDLMDREKLKWIITPTQTFSVSPNDKFVLNLSLSQAKLENDNRSIMSKGGMKRKAESGWYPAPAPIGYLNTPFKLKGLKTIEVDEIKFPILRKIIDEILSGRQAVEVWHTATEEWKLTSVNGKPFSRSAFYYFLNNPLYTGEFEWPRGSSHWYHGHNKPLLTKNEFDLVQKVLGHQGKPIARNHTFDFTGLFRCPNCGCAITATQKVKHYQKTNRTAAYTYYHCTKKNSAVTCIEKPITQKELEDQVSGYLIKLNPPQAFIDWARRWISYLHEHESISQETIHQSQQATVHDLDVKLNRLLDALVNGSVEEEAYKTKKAELESQKTAIQNQLEGTEDKLTDWRAKVENALDFAITAQNRFIHGDRAARQYILNRIGSNFTLSNEKIRIDMLEHFQVLAEYQNWEQKYKGWLEPQKYTDIQRKRPDLVPANPNWLPG
jgi:site-specific DNA recombinase